MDLDQIYGSMGACLWSLLLLLIMHAVRNVLLLGLHTVLFFRFFLLFWRWRWPLLALVDAWVLHLLNVLVNILSYVLYFLYFGLIIVFWLLFLGYLLCLIARFWFLGCLILILKFIYLCLLCLFFLFQSFYFVFELLDQPLVLLVSLHLYILLSMKLFYFMCLCINFLHFYFKLLDSFRLIYRFLNKVACFRLLAGCLFWFEKIWNWFFFHSSLLSGDFKWAYWLSYLWDGMSWLLLFYLGL